MAAWRAPGRVNLMGDHTDYNDGFVLPLAIDRACTVRTAATSGAELEVDTTVPVGSGLSSSSALAVALTLALGGDGLDRVEAARVASAAETAATGVPGGLMDQLASLFGRAGHALLIDCRSTTVTPIAIPASI